MTDRQIIHELVCLVDVFNMQVRPRVVYIQKLHVAVWGI